MFIPVRFFILFFLLFVGLLPETQAQDKRRHLAESQWEEITGGLDYSADRPEKEPPPPKPRQNTGMDWTKTTSLLGKIAQVIVIILLIALLAYGVYTMLKEPRNRQLAQDGVEITADNLENYLLETDLDKFLNEALRNGNYPLAVRIYYLKVIKDFSNRHFIEWSQEKTNREYLREMSSHPLYESFRQATRIFEQVWYGNTKLTEPEFQRLQPAFQTLLNGR